MTNKDDFTKFTKALARLIGRDDVESMILTRWDKGQAVAEDLKRQLEERKFCLKREQLNEILKFYGGEPISEPFFSRLFESEIKSLDDFERAVKRFQIIGALAFGNVKYAFRFFSGILEIKGQKSLGLTDEKPEAVWDRHWPSKTTQKEKLKAYTVRPESPVKLEHIKKENRFYLGEVVHVNSDEKSRREDQRTKGRRNTAVYLASDFMDVYVATSMRTKRQFKNVADLIEKIFEKSKVATQKKTLSELKVRYFDPTRAYASTYEKGLVESLILKRSSVTLYLAQEGDTFGKDSELASTLAQGKKVVVYVPTIDIKKQTKHWKSLADSKKSDELADCLVEYRTIAIQYGWKDADRIESEITDAGGVTATPEEIQETNRKVLSAFDVTAVQKLLKDNDKVAQTIATTEHLFFEKRAKTLLEYHPLSLQVDLRTGVAHGLIVVRNEAQAAKIIFKSLIGSLSYLLEDKGEYLKVLEEDTKSTVRFVTKDPFLTKTFWVHFLAEENAQT